MGQMNYWVKRRPIKVMEAQAKKHGEDDSMANFDEQALLFSDFSMRKALCGTPVGMLHLPQRTLRSGPLVINRALCLNTTLQRFCLLFCYSLFPTNVVTRPRTLEKTKAQNQKEFTTATICSDINEGKYERLLAVKRVLVSTYRHLVFRSIYC